MGRNTIPPYMPRQAGFQDSGMKFHKSSSLPGALVSILLAILFWIALAPIQLGGQVAYVIVDGNSMEPKFQLGDLVITRKQPIYRVGDAVTYENAEMGAFVFHRIVAVSSDRFVLQGDHNTWLDSYQPTGNEIVGKLWLHIPAIGRAIQWARQPLPLAVLCGLVGGLMLMSLFPVTPPRGRRNAKPSGSMGGLLEGGLYLAGFAAMAFLGLGIFAFTRPATRPAETIQYQQAASFFYSATGTPDVYGTDAIRTGDPIFPNLTCTLNVGQAYNVAGSGLQGVAGFHRLYARVMDRQSGWQRSILLESDTPFTGNSYVSMASLDLCQIMAMVSAVEQQTGLHPPFYTLEVISHSTFMGNIADKAVLDSLDTSLVFKFDKTHFYLAADATQGDPLYTTKAGAVGGLEEAPNTLSLLGLNVSILFVRALSVLGLAFSLLALLAGGWYFLRLNQADQAAIIRLKYGGLLMDTRGFAFPQNLPIVDAASVDDLARLAERQNSMIVHTAVNFLHHYFVQANGVLYRYVCEASQVGNVEIEPAARPLLPGSRDDNYLDTDPTGADRYQVRLEAEPNENNQTFFLNRIRL